MTLRASGPASLLLALAALSACPGDDDDSADSSDGSGADAAPPAADAAPGSPDAAPGSPDAGGDVLATCGPATGQTTMTLTAGQILVVHCPDGQPTRVIEGTGAEVSFDTVAGTMVTLFVEENVAFTMLAVGGTIGQPVDLTPGGGTVATATITLPGDFPGAASYSVATGCQNSFDTTTTAAAVDVDVDSGCVGAGGFVVLARAFDAGGAALAYTFATDVAVGDGTPAVVLDAWRTDFVKPVVHLTNAPTPLAGGVGFAGLVGGFGSGPARFELSLGEAGEGEEIAAGASRDIILDGVPAAFADRLIVKAMHGTQTASDASVHYQFRRVAPVVAEVTFDLAAESLPLLFDVGLESTTPGRPVVSWKTSAAVDPTATLVAFFASAAGQWVFMAPAGTTSVQVPQLPASLAARQPAPPFTEPGVAALSFMSVASHQAMLLGGLPAGFNPDGFDEPAGETRYRFSAAGDM